HKKQEVEQRKTRVPREILQESIKKTSASRNFHTALKRENGPVKLLAEIKAASPSQGVIRGDFDPAEIAKSYESCHAAAISVLTDEKYFSGSDRHLQAAKAATSVPILRKDFTIDEYQLYESKAIGADAVLFMAQVLDRETYANLLEKARALDLHVLAEGHTPEQIQFLVEVGADTIGINNRDFTTMQVDIQTTIQNRHLIPADRVVVSQSGIFRREEVILLENAGVDAIQVGTSIMLQDDVEVQLKQLLGRSFLL
ncbi:indole-3-glycerol phosphate synthase TrpC, partial [bacterium]|nr:indole-3-glycerol phosphate synthase TrpC [bacterium]